MRALTGKSQIGRDFTPTASVEVPVKGSSRGGSSTTWYEILGQAACLPKGDLELLTRALLGICPLEVRIDPKASLGKPLAPSKEVETTSSGPNPEGTGSGATRRTAIRKARKAIRSASGETPEVLLRAWVNYERLKCRLGVLLDPEETQKADKQLPPKPQQTAAVSSPEGEEREPPEGGSRE